MHVHSQRRTISIPLHLKIYESVDVYSSDSSDGSAICANSATTDSSDGSTTRADSATGDSSNCGLDLRGTAVVKFELRGSAREVREFWSAKRSRSRPCQARPWDTGLRVPRVPDRGESLVNLPCLSGQSRHARRHSPAAQGDRGERARRQESTRVKRKEHKMPATRTRGPEGRRQ